jgi:hypothetical protein
MVKARKTAATSVLPLRWIVLSEIFNYKVTIENKVT